MALETWTRYKLSALIASNALVIGDGYRAKNSELCVSKSGLPFARAGNINSGFQFDSADYLAAENLLKAGEKVSEPGDVLFTSKGTVGRVAFVSEKTPRFVYSPQLTWWRVKETKRIEPRFLYYWMHGREFSLQINSLRGQTDMADYVSLRDQRQMMHVTLPSLDEQKTIVHILGTLDDKIELNQQMNHTLESIARALFKSWFIDFDPVRAKMDGRQPPGMDTETAALFPDEFEDSAIGKIPKGWTFEQIRDRTSNIQYGLTQSASSDPVGPHFLRITDIRGGAINWSTVPFCKVSSEDYEKYKIKAGDIFVARTGASTGENIYIIEPPNAIFASYLVRFQFPALSIARIVGAFMRTGTYFDYVAGAIGGSAQPNASAQVLAGASLVFPTKEVANSFYKAIHSADLLRSKNDEQSRTLVSIRDALLPKLLSGEIRVQDAEEVLELVL